jgi:predicted TPR repeat methyltransferase
MRPSFRSSGDLLADRRYAYGAAAEDDGDLSAAVELYEQALALAPDWPAAWFALGRARAARGVAGAEDAFAKCLELDPEDTLGASLELARLDGAPLTAAPPAYVRALFDAYADSFDAALLVRLDYRVPRLIADAVAGRRHSRALDLGCGAGLCGEALRPLVERLEGVDLSPRMIAKAREKGVYDALECESLEGRLARDDGGFDLIAAADVFPYLGDLAPVFEGVARRLRPGGCFAFSVEKSGASDILLRDTRRFAHSEAYVRRLAEALNLELRLLREAALRIDGGAPVTGFVTALRKPPGSAGEPAPPR